MDLLPYLVGFRCGDRSALCIVVDLFCHLFDHMEQVVDFRSLLCRALSQRLSSHGHLIGAGIHLARRSVDLLHNGALLPADGLYSLLDLDKITDIFDLTFTGQVPRRQPVKNLGDIRDIHLQILHGSIECTRQLTDLVIILYIDLEVQLSFRQIPAGPRDHLNRSHDAFHHIQHKKSTYDQNHHNRNDRDEL